MRSGRRGISPSTRVIGCFSTIYGVESGLVIGLCTRDPPSYAMLALNRARPVLDQWSAAERLLIAAQASILGKVLSRTVRRFLNEQELLFPVPRMKLNLRERKILGLGAAGKPSKAIAATLGIAKITVDLHVATMLSKMGALNRYQAGARAIATGLIELPDDVHAEYMSAKIHATRKVRRAVAAHEDDDKLIDADRARVVPMRKFVRVHSTPRGGLSIALSA